MLHGWRLSRRSHSVTNCSSRAVTRTKNPQANVRPAPDQLHDPALMLGMKEAVSRILRAVDAGEKILVYGDYDVDGTTGTVVLRRALGLLGAKTGFHVPHRFTEGYGIQQAALEKAREEGYTLSSSLTGHTRLSLPGARQRPRRDRDDHHLPYDG